MLASYAVCRNKYDVNDFLRRPDLLRLVPRSLAIERKKKETREEGRERARARARARESDFLINRLVIPRGSLD